MKEYRTDDVLTDQLTELSAERHYCLVSDGNFFAVALIDSKTDRTLKTVMRGKIGELPFAEIQAFISYGNKVVAG